MPVAAYAMSMVSPDSPDSPVRIVDHLDQPVPIIIDVPEQLVGSAHPVDDMSDAPGVVISTGASRQCAYPVSAHMGLMRKCHPLGLHRARGLAGLPAQVGHRLHHGKMSVNPL